MIFSFPRHLATALLLAGLTNAMIGVRSTAAGPPAIDFNRDVRPILAKHCYACHGPDEDARAAGLRLDTEAGAREDLGGYQAIMPGAPDDSELMIRVTSDDEDLRMPSSDRHEPLKPADVDTLRRWIEGGAEYNPHWSFIAAEMPAIPAVENQAWCRNPIDRFVLAKLEQQGLHPSAEADRAAIVRRVYLDLVGVVPSVEEVDQFLVDERPDAYERLVDKLLASSRYGERAARSWLDLARYSDTNGYEKDRPRTIWPYRDWVINAINQDLPYDQFSIEQLAGDMLESPTTDQRVATGFHRNTMLNEEGGIDPLEYRFHAVVDRVATTGTVWLGLTTGCAQCHTHKFDPITHTDYYALMALLNNADEPEMAADSVATISKQDHLQAASDELEHSVVSKLFFETTKDNDAVAGFVDWAKARLGSIANWNIVVPTQMNSTMPLLQLQDDGSVLASGDATKRDVYRLTMPAIDAGAVTAIRIEALTDVSLPAEGPGLAYYEGRRGDFFLSEVDVAINGEALELAVGTTSVPGAAAGNGKTYPGNVFDNDGSTGWSIPGGSGQSHRLVIPFAKPTTLDQPWTVELLFERHYVAGLGKFRLSVTTDPNPIASDITVELQQRLTTTRRDHGDQSFDLDQWPADVSFDLAKEYFRTEPSLASQRKLIEDMRRAIPVSVRTLVMKERPESNPRDTQRHHRGEYLQGKETVEPAVPEFLANPDDPMPADRLEMAEWLVSRSNPLVGRVTANRAWREFFGTGIVKTSGDFGTQSETPTHPELIDYLDQRLRDQSPNGWQWSIKRLHREIVLSATYRQAIAPPPETDPSNRLLSSFPYRRYDAERIRDAFLSAAGLLSDEIGGPSVRPPQPSAVTQIAYGNPAWQASDGADRYRRSLYTFSKRTAPFAAYATFDAPSGEVCIAKRDRSTTPLQALTLLNDAMYLEIASALAEQTLRDCGDGAKPQAIVQRMFRRVLSRHPDASEADAILQFYHSQSEHPQPWMLVARTLMNLDEAITTP
ncbi:PSD1 and planctomycete cytochrome C domain-containing protein [Rhodopirellula sp. MGV]|uniref:PSD1 and planctomycete cytochrome C domain-containing protein n=1 Tax=Rhodopirellula sp. MGV TaxID=2023130 RepID=UPI000B9696AB|nr:PSD1 and planctomycete cytochrome C domain-containing protein [Rhodopirellula sp. MGV]OYP38365.1 hypothetical protein CGZ80_02110 [Rhodopirellula sp. MGV]PNY34212.1 DUF1549 domain-containing protein [Rhodopirellula baltica]